MFCHELHLKFSFPSYRLRVDWAGSVLSCAIRLTIYASIQTFISYFSTHWASQGFSKASCASADVFTALLEWKSSVPSLLWWSLTCVFNSSWHIEFFFSLVWNVPPSLQRYLKWIIPPHLILMPSTSLSVSLFLGLFVYLTFDLWPWSFPLHPTTVHRLSIFLLFHLLLTLSNLWAVQ